MLTPVNAASHSTFDDFWHVGLYTIGALQREAGCIHAVSPPNTFSVTTLPCKSVDAVEPYDFTHVTINEHTLSHSKYEQESRAIARRTARWRCKFRHVSNFTTELCGFSAIARLSCIPFKCWNYTQYADFHGRGGKIMAKAENHGTQAKSQQ